MLCGAHNHRKSIVGSYLQHSIVQWHIPYPTAVHCCCMHTLPVRGSKRPHAWNEFSHTRLLNPGWPLGGCPCRNVQALLPEYCNGRPQQQAAQPLSPSQGPLQQWCCVSVNNRQNSIKQQPYSIHERNGKAACPTSVWREGFKASHLYVQAPPPAFGPLQTEKRAFCVRDQSAVWGSDCSPSFAPF